MAKGDLRNILGFDEEARLDAWLSSQSDIATFFLDSIDELKLSLGSFEEAVTADEKETDIRLLSTTSPNEAVIELKLADGRSANDLRDTLEAQLVKKYMATETRRSGCLMITISKNRHWNHPDTGSKIDFKELVTLLREEADNIMQKLGSSLRLHICALDLRPRLPTEAKRKKAENNSKSSRSAK